MRREDGASRRGTRSQRSGGSHGKRIMKRRCSRLWTGRCRVSVRKTRVNEENGRNEPYEEVLFEDEPCRLSFQLTCRHIGYRRGGADRAGDKAVSRGRAGSPGRVKNHGDAGGRNAELLPVPASRRFYSCASGDSCSPRLRGGPDGALGTCGRFAAQGLCTSHREAERLGDG